MTVGIGECLLIYLDRHFYDLSSKCPLLPARSLQKLRMGGGAISIVMTGTPPGEGTSSAATYIFISQILLSPNLNRSEYQISSEDMNVVWVE